MKQIRLYGHLATKFGRDHALDVQSPAEAVRALCAIFPGFEQHVIQHNSPGYKVFVSGEGVSEEELHTPRSNEVIRIVPVISGAGKGLGKILLGVALIGLSFVPGMQAVAFLGRTAASFAFQMGTGLLLSGISSLLSSPQQGNAVQERPEDKPSFYFDGPTNTQREGNAVTVIYGRHIVGSQVASASMRVSEEPV